MKNVEEMICEFVDKDTIAAHEQFLEKKEGFEKVAGKIAALFGAKPSFAKISDDDIKKLEHSFKNNLTLLIQKTWVEEADIAQKERLLYQLDNFFVENENEWKKRYPLFLEIIDSAVFLMFGKQAKSEDFFEYSLRIDPEFGIFWWYIGSLPMNNDWSEEKCKLAILIGMFFLANY